MIIRSSKTREKRDGIMEYGSDEAME